MKAQRLNVKIESMPELAYSKLGFLFHLLCSIADRNNTISTAYNILLFYSDKLNKLGIIIGISGSHIWISTKEGQRFIIITGIE